MSLYQAYQKPTCSAPAGNSPPPQHPHNPESYSTTQSPPYQPPHNPESYSAIQSLSYQPPHNPESYSATQSLPYQPPHNPESYSATQSLPYQPPHNPESYSAIQSLPYQTPHQYQQQHQTPYSMSQQHQSPQAPNMAYQPQQPMTEKPHAQASVNEHHPQNRPPASRFGRDWVFGLFDCFSPLGTCCLGTWCPCILFGKTYAREHGDGESNGCTGMCCAWYCAASLGFNSCLQCIMRSQQRERHGIEGSSFGDFCASFWCSCCTLIQEEKESVVRITGIDPKTKVQYQPLDQGMHYPA